VADPRRRIPIIRALGLALRPPLMVLTKRDRRGLENIPDGGFVLAANHISHLDPLTFAHVTYDLDISPRYLAKASLFDVPVFGRIITAAGQIPVHRSSSRASDAFATAVERVRAGEVVIVYAEGTITRDPDLWPMKGKTGAARIAIETGRPLVPVAQWGTHEVLYPYAKRPRFLPRKTIAVNVGEPLDLSDLAGLPTSAAAARATERLMSEIARLLGELRGETPPAELMEWSARPRADRASDAGGAS